MLPDDLRFVTAGRIGGTLMRVARTVPADNWQPIETAPQDGTPIIVTDGKAVGEASYHKDADGWFLAGNDPSDAYGGAMPDLTFWQHLPKPPAKARS
jgi:hypothetical protein